MFKIKFQFPDNSVLIRHTTWIPKVGDQIAFYAHNMTNTAEIAVRNFGVAQVVAVLRDPNPKEGYISEGIGDEMFIVRLIQTADSPTTQEETE
jgi:hypothetical protein